MKFRAELRGVCAKSVTIIISDGVIMGIDLTGGCDGQRQVINALAAGMPAEDFISRVESIRCGNKTTSCAAEIAKAISGYLQTEDESKK